MPTFDNVDIAVGSKKSIAVYRGNNNIAPLLLPRRVIDIFSKFGSDAHLYLPGPGVPILGPELIDASAWVLTQPTAGNALPKASIYRDILPKFGITLAKSGSGQGSASFFGPAGLDDPLALTAKGWGGMTAAQNQVQGLLQTGGILVWFGHDCPVYDGVSTRDGPSVTNGGGMWAEDAPLIADYLKSLVVAGSIDVVSPSQLAAILDGTA